MHGMLGKVPKHRGACVYDTVADKMYYCLTCVGCLSSDLRALPVLLAPGYDISWSNILHCITDPAPPGLRRRRRERSSASSIFRRLAILGFFTTNLATLAGPIRTGLTTTWPSTTTSAELAHATAQVDAERVTGTLRGNKTSVPHSSRTRKKCRPRRSRCRCGHWRCGRCGRHS